MTLKIITLWAGRCIELKGDSPRLTGINQGRLLSSKKGKKMKKALVRTRETLSFALNS